MPRPVNGKWQVNKVKTVHFKPRRLYHGNKTGLNSGSGTELFFLFCFIDFMGTIPFFSMLVTASLSILWLKTFKGSVKIYKATRRKYTNRVRNLPIVNFPAFHGYVETL